MRTLKHLGLLAFLIIFVPFYSYGQDLYLRTQDTSYSCFELNQVMADILKSADERNILFFIHGRGKHPQKGLAYLPQFEDNFNLRIVMFHWDSWINSISRPEESAKNSGEYLNYCLGQLNEFKNKNKEEFIKRKLFFMVHSMGNIAFRSFLQNYYDQSFKADLFDAVVMNAPDLEAKNHELWVDKINFSKKVFITFNGDDFTLTGSRVIDYKDLKFFKGPRLGANPKQYSSKITTYLDFSNLTFGGHEYFLEDRHHPISQIFQDIFTLRRDFRVSYKTSSKSSNVLIFQTNKSIINK